MRSRQVKILELHMEGNQKAWPWRLRGRDSCAAEVQELQQAKKNAAEAAEAAKKASENAEPSPSQCEGEGYC